MVFGKARFRRRLAGGVLAAAVVLVVGLHAAARAFAAQEGDSTKTVDTTVARPGIEPGLGSEQREPLRRAQDLVLGNRIDEAERLLGEIIGAIEAKLGDDGRIRVCVANHQEFERFAAEHGGAAKVVWVDWAYREAIQTEAFIAGARGDFDKALAMLERVETLAPYDPAAFLERGFALNKLRRSKEALESYRHAYDLSQHFESARPSAPAALRGIGFSLVELGDLKGGRKAYEDSLKLEPNNPTAVQELEYIRSLEAQKP
jgi:Flp pilus assembly protein TadD